VRQPEYNEWTTKFVPLQNAILEGASATGAKLIVGDNLYMYGKLMARSARIFPMTPPPAKARPAPRLPARLWLPTRAASAPRHRARLRFLRTGCAGFCLRQPHVPARVQGKAAEGLGDLDAPHTYSYIDDFGKYLVLLGARDEALGQAWHIPLPRRSARAALSSLSSKISVSR